VPHHLPFIFYVTFAILKVTPKPLRQVMVSVTPQNAAANGNLEALKIMAEADRANLFKRDQNGWRPIHEAARSGHVHVLEYLLKEGARINERTNDGEGGNPLWWAEKNAEKNREAIKLLKKYGGVSLQPKILDDKEEKSDPKKKED
jgi:ankyrin repeat protein